MGFTHHKAKGKGYHELNMHISWGIRRWGFLWEMKSGIDITLHRSSKGESQFITQLSIPSSLFSWLYYFPMFAMVIIFPLSATDDYPIFPSNNFLFLFFWLYPFSLFAANNDLTSLSNNFFFSFLLYSVFMVAVDNNLNFFCHSLLPAFNQLQP